MCFALASSLLLASVAVPAWAQSQPGAYVGHLNTPAGYLEVVNPTTYAVYRLPFTPVCGYTTAAGTAYRLVGR